MKKGLLIFFVLFNTAKVYAQISDVDAKLLFQNISDAYESSAFYQSAIQSEDLEKKMGRWTPKVLHMYLQSVYRCYTSGNLSNNRFDGSYLTVLNFKNLSDTFFTLIDKETYPKEKYAEIITAQKYFSALANKLEYQTSRTPEKAIAFLNETAAKFPAKTYGNDTEKVVYHYIKFTIDSSYLRIVSVRDKFSYHGNYSNTLCTYNDYIDLKHLPAKDEGKAPDNRLYYFPYESEHYNRHFKLDERDTAAAINFLWENGIQYLIFKTRFIPSGIYKKEKVIGPYLLPDFFETTSDEFKHGDYAKRINEAFSYLLNYYPKEKTKVLNNKKTDSQINGF